MEVPHGDLERRAYAAVPAAEVAPARLHPTTRRRLDALAGALGDRSLVLLEERARGEL